MRLNRQKLITIGALLLFSVVIFLPPILYGYVYPNVGDDATGHLAVFDSIQDGSTPRFAYLAHVIIGYPLVWISNLFDISIDSVFLWFSFMALALVGITLYLVVSRLVNKQAGWLTLVLTLFGAQGILFQFYFGQIFNLINIGIILPWLLYFTVRYLEDKKISQLVLVIIFVGLFGSFHTSGIYLPFIAGFTTVVYVIYSRIKKQGIELQGVVLGGSIVAFSIIVAVFLDPFALMGKGNIGANIFYIVTDLMNRMAVPVANYILDIVSLLILAGLIFTCMFYKDVLKNIRSETKSFLTILLCTAGILLVVTFTKLSFDSWRTALDLATILTLIVAISVGLLMELWKNKFVRIGLVLIVGLGLLQNIPTWFSYNSAIRPADRQAIAYANSLNYESYASSAEVAFWIYSRFMDAEYRTEIIWEWNAIQEKDVPHTESDSDIVIVRSKPMTPRSDKNNMWYDDHGFIPDDSFELTKTFRDSQVEVSIYERK